MYARTVARVHVVGERAREQRRGRGPREVLEVVVGKGAVLVRPLHVGVVELQVIREVPLERLAARVAPDAAVEDELHRDARGDGGGDHALQIVVGDGTVAAFAREIEGGIEGPVAARARRRAHVQDRHRHADTLRAREERPVCRGDLGGAAVRDAGGHHQEVEGARGLGRRSIEQGRPVLERGGRHDAAATEDARAAVAGHGNHGDLVPLRLRRREVAAEAEARCPRLRIVRVHLRDVGARQAVLCGSGYAIEQHVDARNTRRVERPARHGDAVRDDGIGLRRIDVADRSGVGSDARLCERARSPEDRDRRDRERTRGPQRPTRYRQCHQDRALVTCPQARRRARTVRARRAGAASTRVPDARSHATTRSR